MVLCQARLLQPKSNNETFGEKKEKEEIFVISEQRLCKTEYLN